MARRARRRQEMVIQSVHGTEEGFDLKRQTDGELHYDADEHAQAPADDGDLVAFHNRAASVICHAPVAAVGDADVVILGQKFYVRRLGGFYEAKALRADMPVPK